MTQEEKAKAYDEAKLRMSAAYNSNRCTIGFMNEIFPELAESEDERIRAKLIEFFAGYTTDEEWWGSVTEKDILAWLKNIQYAIEHAKREGFQLGYKAGIEKQGEQILANSAKNCKDEQKPIKEHNVCDFCDEKHGCVNPCPTKLIEEEKPADKIQLGKKYKCIASPRYSTFMIGKIYKPEDKFLCSLMNFCSDCFEPVEDGEQKPLTNDEEIGKAAEEYRNFRMACGIKDLTELSEIEEAFYKGAIRTLDRQKEEKPVEWSDADENTLLDTINILRSCGRCSTDRKLWLLSLKDRIQPQPKQEWNEEDERLLESCIYSFKKDIEYEEEHNKCNAKAKIEGCKEKINWLKSLRPQSQWKPSEEMLEALYRAIPENTMAISEDSMLLDKLYQGLKYGRVLSNKQ